MTEVPLLSYAPCKILDRILPRSNRLVGGVSWQLHFDGTYSARKRSASTVNDDLECTHSLPPSSRAGQSAPDFDPARHRGSGGSASIVSHGWRAARRYFAARDS